MQELADIGLGGLNLNDWGSHGRAKRERHIFEIVNDREDKKFHNGPEQTLCLLEFEKIQDLVVAGYPIFPGALGENLTTEKLNYRELRSGSLIRIGNENGILIRITFPRTPCMTIQPYGEIINKLKNLSGPERRNLIKEMGYTENPEHEKYGESGFYASIDEIYGNGIIMVGSRLRIQTNLK